MGKYLKLFNNHAAYEAFTETEDFVLPNVSHCIQQNDVHYNPYIPANVVKYYNQAIIESYKEGAYQNAQLYGIKWESFVDANGDSLTIVSHTFADGVGTVTFDGDIASFGDAFYESEIEGVEIPRVTQITEMAFYRDAYLTDVIIPDTVRSIGYNAFVMCNNLQEITLPSSVTSIGDYAFEDCSNLASVTVLATTPPTLGTYTFGDNASGRKIYVPADSVNTYKAANGWSNYASDIVAIGTPVQVQPGE